MHGYAVIAAGLAILWALGFQETLWLLTPIVAANQMRYLPLPKIPVDEEYLGPGKTYDAYFAGPFFGFCALAFLWCFAPWLSMRFGAVEFADALKLGGLIGLGVVAGDQINSFIKRLWGFERGAWFVGDHLNYGICGGIAAKLVLDDVGWTEIAIVIAITVPIHILGNRSSFHLGLRESKH